jgi:hypothetical protein
MSTPRNVLARREGRVELALFFKRVAWAGRHPGTGKI